MGYRRFEQLVIAVGALAVFASTALMTAPGLPWQELAGQALLVVVLAVAMHWGRRGGFAAAAIASLAYLAILTPLLVEETVGAGDLAVIVSRVLAFGAVGIVGGEISIRVKYALSEIDGMPATDRVSGVYSRDYGVRALTVARERLRRYDEPYSLVLLSLSPDLTADARAARRRSVIRTCADHVRGDVRMVDEVSYLDDGRFMVLLPHTPRMHAGTVSERLARGVQAALGAPDATVTASCLGGAEDAHAIDVLLERLGETPDQASGSYREGASSTLKPPARRTAGAPSASTLRMSTAAAPDGSTKQ